MGDLVSTAEAKKEYFLTPADMAPLDYWVPPTAYPFAFC
jgi:hypothetical protein